MSAAPAHGGLKRLTQNEVNLICARHDRLLSGVRKNDSNDWSRSYFSALMKAGQRRAARSPKSSPEMGQALERLQSSAKKNIPPSRLTANVVT